MPTTKTNKLLPAVFQTSTNKKFLNATLDQLTTNANLKVVNGYIGRKFAPGFNGVDTYVKEPTLSRADYQLEPSVIYRNQTNSKVEFASTYPETLQNLSYLGANVANQNNLWSSEYYSFDPKINLDAFVNFSQYYWLQQGPDVVNVTAGTAELETTYTVNYQTSNNTYNIFGYGTLSNPDLVLARGGTYRFNVNQSGHGFYIQTDPGLTGTQADNNNLSSRQILGVTNNGTDSGTVVFSVPAKTAQDSFISMPSAGIVDFVITQTYAQIQNQLLSDIVTNFGGIDGQSINLDSKYIIFGTYSAADSDWTEGVTTVPLNQRYGIWQITLTPVGDDYTVTLAYDSAITVNNKVTIRSGTDYSNTEWYKSILGYLIPVPVITANKEFLYYQDSKYPTAYGRIRLIDADSPNIDVNNDILNKQNYISPNGIIFSNGLKIRFDNTVIPTSYQYKTYYVEGVGTAIKLIDADLLDLSTYDKTSYKVDDNFTADATATISSDNTNFTIQTTNFPDNITVLAGTFPNGQTDNYIVKQNATFNYPYRGGLNASGEHESVTIRSGIIGVAIPGIYLYAPYDNLYVNGDNGTTWHLNGPEAKINGQDTYGGTPTYRYNSETIANFANPAEQYAYYYQDSKFITANAWGNVTGFTAGSYTHSDGHSKIIGFAADGYPIYGPYGYTDSTNANTPVIRMVSSYILNVITTNRPAAETVTIEEDVVDSNILNVGQWNLRAGMRITVNSAGLTPSSVYIINTYADSLQLNPTIGINNYYNINFVTLSESVTLTAGDTLTFEFLPGAFIEDYMYLPNYGTLDQYNGRYCVTPDFPNGTYAYFATQDTNNNPVYPYFIGSAFYGSLTPDSLFDTANIDYITINRASQDLNAWTVRNKWFHQDVIEKSAAYNNKTAAFMADQRAKRPIIEFIADLQLYDFGNQGLEPVDFYDITSKLPLQNIEGQIGYYADGKFLFDGAKIVFPNALDSDVKNKIWLVTYITPSGTQPVIHLEPYATAVENDTINVKSGINYGGKSFYFNGINWRAGQQKLSINQSPYFDVMDSDGISYGSTSRYPIASSENKFIGTKIFNYKLNDLNVDDTVLGLPISYRSITNIGDIEFTNYYDNDSFQYVNNGVPTTLKVNTGYIYQNNSDGTKTKYNVWTKCVENSKQFQLLSYTFDGINNSFTVDVIPEPSVDVPNIRVFVNFTQLPVQKFRIYSIPNNKIVIRIEPEYISENDRIDIQVYSASVSNLGFYQIPNNLNNNSQNDIVKDVTLGSLRNHIGVLTQNSTLFNGPFPGQSNLRDINIVAQGGTILQQSAPTIYSTLFLNNPKYDFVKSVQYAQQEYTRFKNKFLSAAISLGNINYQQTVSAVDSILKKINEIKNNTFPWYYSDLIPYGDNKNTITYTVFDVLQKNYELTNVFTLENPSNKAVLIYLNGEQLQYGIDYTFQSLIPAVTLSDTLTIEVDDVLTIVEYANTDGCYVPETPTKLGLYPKFQPELFTDYTYNTPVQFIRGHDGSLTPAFDDYRDNLLLELENRIFNNIKTEYNTDLINIYETIPGKFRDTGITLSNYNALLGRNYLQWAGNNNIDYVKNDIYNQTDSFTYNYALSSDIFDSQNLPGSWRACYNYFYDTQNPNTRPWEMLGFSIEPDWWQDTYGPAPYTKGNSLLWADLENGYIRSGERQGTDSNFARPGLSGYLPVDMYGNLISPLGLLTQDFDNSNFANRWSVGQLGPAENAWKNSSEYAFSLQIVMATTKPAKYFSLGLIKNKYKYNTELDQYLVTSTNYRLTPADIEVNGYKNSAGSISRVSGYLNWITDYQTANGILDKTPLYDYVRYFNVNLAYRAAGFTSKDRLKVLAEQFSPNSINQSIIIPDADFDIVLHKSTPLTKIRYSAVIIEKQTNGFKISGYDTNNPYFTLFAPNVNGSFDNLTVLNRSVKFYNTGIPNRINITYGIVLETLQQVVSFLSGYSAYLQSQGFRFEYFDPNLVKIRDWKLSAEEFLFWTQQGWQTGTTIVLSPIASNLSYFYNNAIVDEVKGAYQGSRILNQSFLTLNTDAYTVERDGNAFNLSLNNSNNNLIGLADLNLVQYEHIIIFKNKTQFNDVIYEPESGARQFRLRLVGTKTGDWQGSLSAPGFMYATSTIDQWQPNKDYLKSDLVEYKNFYYSAKQNIAGATKFSFSDWLPVNRSQIKEGLVNNFAYNASISEDFYNINNINLESDFDLFSLGLIGYKNRYYLNNVGLNDATQVKLYQGFIKTKGTKNAANAFQNINIGNQNKELELSEDWAFRAGTYGSTDTHQYIELNLNEDFVLNNPTSIEVYANLDVNFNNINTVPDNVYKTASTPWSPPIFLTRTNNSVYTDDIQTAGYVNLEDIDLTIFDLNNPTELINNINQVGLGQKIWTAKDFNQDWNVFTVSRTPSGATVISITRELTNTDNTSQFLVVTDRPHFLNVDDLAIIIPTTNENQSLASVYKIISTPDLTSFIATAPINAFSLTAFSSTLINASLYSLVSIKLQYATDLVEFVPTWTPNSKVWINNYDNNGWAVYNKSEPWSSNLRLTITTPSAQSKLGSSITVTKDETFIVVGEPGYNNNEGAVLTLSADEAGIISENNLIKSAVSEVEEFGISVSAGTEYFSVGAPGTTSNIGHVEIYTKNFLGISSLKSILTPNTNDPIRFGYSITLSQDDQWLYVGAPDDDKVFVYQFIANIDEHTSTIIADGVTTTYSLPFLPYSPDSVLLSNISSGLLRYLKPYQDYIVTNNIINFTVPPEAGGITVAQYPCFILANTIQGEASSKFGFSVSSTIDGRQVAIGAPNETVTASPNTYTLAGTLSIYDRSVERFIANGAQTTFTSIYSITANNTVYLNNDLATDYNIVGNDVIFVDPPENQSIVEIESNHFNLIQKLNANLLETGQKYGYSSDICVSSCSLYVGAPYQSNPIISSYESGVVYTYINQSRAYGTIESTIANATVTIGDSIRINDFVVTFTGSTYASVINDINNADIPGVTASNVNYKLNITSNSKLSTNLLRVLPAEGTGLADLGLEVFVLTQEILHPKNKAYEYFGQKIKRTYSSDILAISSKDATSDLRLTFDVAATQNIPVSTNTQTNTEYLENSTTYDADSTRFVDPGNGAAWVYNYLPDSRNTLDNPGLFYFVQNLLPVNANGNSQLNNTFYQFGADIAVVSKFALVGAPGYDPTGSLQKGKIDKFINTTGLQGWDVYRSANEKVDIDSILKAYIYSIKGSNIIYTLDYIDPAKGKILGPAEQDISYKTDYDPAIYNNGNNNSNLSYDNLFHWNERQVGQVWWDLSTLRYIDYEQGSIKYRTTNWGVTFPGSSIDVYEWVESIYPPSQYKINGGIGDPKNPDNSAFVTISYVDSGTNTAIVKYYYWVKNITSLNSNYKGRSLPIATIANYIRDPKNSGIKYFAAISTDAVAIYNVNKTLSGKDRVMHIDYITESTENIIHNEYQLVSEAEKTVDGLPDNIINKLRDSLSRIDIQGNPVPDIALAPQNKYGISIRPRQNIFINQTEAIRELVLFANTVFSKNVMSQGFDLTGLTDQEEPPVEGEKDQNGNLKYNIAVDTYDELTYLNIKLYDTGYKVLVNSDSTANGLWTIYTKQSNETWKLTKVQSYDTSEYWTYSDWYAEGYNSSIEPTYTVDTIVDISNLTLQSEDIVKVKNTGQGKWAIIQVWPTFISTIAIEAGTIEFKESLYNLPDYFMGFSNERFSVDRFDHNPNIEIRKIFDALKNNLFINQLSQEFVNLFFVLVKYAIAEQKSLDWVFKTSLIKLNQITKNLGQPKIYSKNNQELFEEYIKEVKPFRTTIREFVDQYQITDNLNGYVADFDVPAVFDPVLGIYRSPSGEYGQDTSLLSQPQYFDWVNGYKYYVSGFIIENGGTGYTEPPVITITGSTINDNARAEAVLTDGVITRINVIYPGSNYITQPVITITGGNGSGALLYALMTNDVVRKIKTTLVYDRLTYGTDLLEWSANTAYTVDDKLVYNNTAYRVNFNFVSGSTFSAEIAPDGRLTPLQQINQNSLETANDRITAYYTPTPAMTGKILSSLQTGINYPGVTVVGQAFKESGGFDVMNFDETTFDSVDFDMYGTPIVPGSTLDTIIESEYTDPYLSANAESIIIDGAAYVDQYSSHAPEELIPGIVFDTLDITVTTFATNAAAAGYTTWLTTTAFYLDDVVIVDGGSGYTASSTISLTVSGGGGSGASATATTDSNGSIISVSVVSGGSIYTSIPNVTATSSNTSPAILTARLAQNTYNTFTYRIFKDKNDNYQYLRESASASTTLASALSLTADSIVVTDSSVLPMPAPNSTVICSVTINGERIIYFDKDDATNTLTNLIRGAYGTGANLHASGSTVIDSSYTQIVPMSSNYTWTPNTNTVLTSISREVHTFYGNTTYIRSNAWIALGVMEPIITEDSLTLLTEDEDILVTQESEYVDGHGLYVSTKTPAVFVRQN